MNIFIFTGIVLLLSGCTDPINMSDTEINKAYQDIKANDSRARNVHIYKGNSTLVIHRSLHWRDTKAGQKMQAQSWCSSFPEVKYVQIYDLSNKLRGSTSCRR